MIGTPHRIRTFFAWAFCFGESRARTAASRWRAALKDPVLLAHLVEAGYVNDPMIGDDGQALPDAEVHRRLGARGLALNILALAEITSSEINHAIEELNNAQKPTGALVPAEYDQPDLLE